MAGKKPMQKRRRVTFRLVSTEASEIFVVGDFNDWEARKHPMKPDGTGSWKKVLMLKPGRYEYRFRVDGRWCDDPENDHRVPNCFGSQNNVVQVPD
ncbi:MAG: isoamylase early set domain-containing protein [Desulfobacterales bacterium]|nr:isoamylase early set domain-containing protein [Desulfobacterales bacterium]